MRAANLARQPFRNERIPNLLVALAAVALLGLTVKHALVVRALLPARTSALHEEVRTLEAEATRLRAEEGRLRTVSPEAAALARWVVVKDIVDRRAFSWTALFSRLEEKLPAGARVTSLAPSVRHGNILLEVQAVVRSSDVGWEVVRALEEGGDFADVFPISEGENGEFRYTMRYLPRPEARPTAPSAPGGAGGAR